jgi:hypothetical protein
VSLLLGIALRAFGFYVLFLFGAHWGETADRETRQLTRADHWRLFGYAAFLALMFAGINQRNETCHRGAFVGCLEEQLADRFHGSVRDMVAECDRSADETCADLAQEEADENR